MTAKVVHNSGVMEWYTPSQFTDAARRTMGGIDLDPASSATADEVVRADKYFTEADDGLTREWAGRVWINPPYARGLIERFAGKLIESIQSGQVTQACVLVNNSTDTRWFQSLAETASAICLLAGRVSFWSPGVAAGKPIQGQCVLYSGDRAHRFADEFSVFGHLCTHARVE